MLARAVSDPPVAERDQPLFGGLGIGRAEADPAGPRAQRGGDPHLVGSRLPHDRETGKEEKAEIHWADETELDPVMRTGGLGN